MKRSNIFLCLIMCICLCGCSKEDSNVIDGAFGTGESVSESKIEESSESDEAKFAIKDDITLSTEETDSDINVSLSSLQQAKINEIEQNLKSESLEVTKDEVTELLNIDEFVNISDSEKLLLATEIVDRISDLSISETLDSNLVYKHASSYETDEIIIDEEAPLRVYSSEELESMHEEAESLYQQQQTAETFEFDD